MITLDEMLKGKSMASLPLAHQGNLKVLWFRINKVRTAYGHPMVVTNCYRSMAEHLKIYKDKGVTKVPLMSKHLSGCAVDIADPTGELNAWCKANQTLLKQIGLWCENRQGNWQHFQSEPFKSYKLDGSVFFAP